MIRHVTTSVKLLFHQIYGGNEIYGSKGLPSFKYDFVCMLWAIHLNLATVLVGSGMCHRPGGLWEVPPSWWALEGATVLVVSGRRHRPGGLWQVPPSWWVLATYGLYE